MVVHRYRYFRVSFGYGNCLDCGKTLSKFLARPGNPTRIEVEYADAQPNWQLPYMVWWWYRECDWLFSCSCSSFYGLIGFIGLAQCWGVFGWSILHLAIQLLKNRHRLMVCATIRLSHDWLFQDCWLLSDDNLAIKNRMRDPRRSFCEILFYNLFVLFLSFS